MGLTYVEVELGNPSRSSRRAHMQFLVDSGAIYSLAPGNVLRRLGIKPLRNETFELADGSHMRRPVGLALFTVGKKRGGSGVIFGAPTDEPLLGAVTLEALGLTLDAARQKLAPAGLLMTGFRRRKRRARVASRAGRAR